MMSTEFSSAVPHPHHWMATVNPKLQTVYNAPLNLMILLNDKLSHKRSHSTHGHSFVGENVDTDVWTMTWLDS